MVGLLIALGTGADIFQVLDIPFRIPHWYGADRFDDIRGANFIHDLFIALKIGNESRQLKKIEERNRPGLVEMNKKQGVCMRFCTWALLPL